jgi:hypothetical protein
VTHGLPAFDDVDAPAGNHLDPTLGHEHLDCLRRGSPGQRPDLDSERWARVLDRLSEEVGEAASMLLSAAANG